MIGIFDSGMGGLSVLKTAMKLLPKESFIYYGDSKNAPYGTKTKEEVTELSIKICDYLISRGVKAIVVACNTATSAAIKVLRDKYDIPIIGMEPALKPALEDNKGGSIVVMATPMTLKEDKFKNLVKRLPSTTKIYKMPAPKIVELVEEGKSNTEAMDRLIEDYFKEIPHDSIESIVLGCTHFIFVQNSLRKVLEHVKLFDGNEGTINQLIRKINVANESNRSIEIINSGGAAYESLSRKLLDTLEV